MALPESISDSEDYLDIDVTRLVQAMAAAPSSNFGFLIKLQDETDYRRLNFASSEHADPARHPKLVITYQPR